MWRLVLFGWVWLLGAWLAARRRPRTRPEHYARQDFPTQTRGRGLRMTEWLRDHLRPGWLHLHRPARHDHASADEP